MPVPYEAMELACQLATVPLFKDLTLEILRPIIALGHLTSISAGKFFFNEGDDAVRFFVLASGRVKLTQLTPEGRQVVLGHIGPGDAFGGVGAFGDPTYPVSAETVEPSVALAWTSGTMKTCHPRSALRPPVVLCAITTTSDRPRSTDACSASGRTPNGCSVQDDAHSDAWSGTHASPTVRSALQ